MKFSIGIITIALLALGGWYMVSDQTDEPRNGGTELTITASFYPLAFAAERIVGDIASVENISGARDPHDVRLSTQDVRKMQESDLVLLQGAGLEPWGDDTAEQLAAADVPVFVATADLMLMNSDGHDEHSDDHADEHDDGHVGHDHEEDHEAGEHTQAHDAEEADHENEDEHMHEGDEHDAIHEEHVDESEHDHGSDHSHDHGESNPHTWLDPVLFSETVEHLTEAIVALDPDNAPTYEENAAALRTELAALDAEYAHRLSSCALDEVITSHDAFGYLGERYGFAIHTIAGISTQDLPSAPIMTELKTEAAEGVGAILLEENSVSAYGETLAQETGLQTLSINPVAYAFAEGEDYFSVMRSNLDTFAVALDCDE